MMEENKKNQPNRDEYGKPAAQQESRASGNTDMFSCCGGMMAQSMRGCCCSSAFKNFKWVCLAIITFFVLAFLVSQMGGIMGIAAFFRSL